MLLGAALPPVFCAAALHARISQRSHTSMCSTPSAFSVFLEQQLRELHHQLVEKHEEPYGSRGTTVRVLHGTGPKGGLEIRTYFTELCTHLANICNAPLSISQTFAMSSRLNCCPRCGSLYQSWSLVVACSMPSLVFCLLAFCITAQQACVGD